MTDKQNELLIEGVASAWRPRNPYGLIESHPAWHDLDSTRRIEAYEVAMFERTMERAIDPNGLSSTARAVLKRISGE